MLWDVGCSELTAIGETQGHRPSNVKIAPAGRRNFQQGNMGGQSDSQRYQDVARSGLMCGVREEHYAAVKLPFQTCFHPSTQNQNDNRVSLSALITIALIPYRADQ